MQLALHEFANTHACNIHTHMHKHIRHARTCMQDRAEQLALHYKELRQAREGTLGKLVDVIVESSKKDEVGVRAIMCCVFTKKDEVGLLAICVMCLIIKNGNKDEVGVRAIMCCVFR